MTYDEACAAARARLGSMGWSGAGAATCAQVADKLKSDTNLFVCPDPIRIALVGGCGGSPPPPGGGPPVPGLGVGSSGFMAWIQANPVPSLVIAGVIAYMLLGGRK